MTRSVSLLGAIAILIVAGLASTAQAVTIDDFAVGSFTFTGPAGPFDQIGLNTSHVIGGGRRTQITNSASVLDISAPLGRMDFDASPNRGYFTLTYGALGPLNADLTVGGHDRIRLKLTEVVAVSPLLANFSVRDTANVGRTFNLENALTALNGGGGVIDLLYGTGTINFASISNITLDLVRYTPNGTIVIDDIVTAGPPLPGDYNRDGAVNDSDYLEWHKMYGKSSAAGVLLGPDGNGNGKVDIGDYSIWRDNVGAFPGAGAGSASAIPEPAGCAMILAVVILRIGNRRRCGPHD